MAVIFKLAIIIDTLVLRITVVHIFCENLNNKLRSRSVEQL